MYAIEFQARVTNGNIKIPEEFRDQLIGSVRVIVLAEERPASADMIDRLLASPIKVENFVPIKREEIYERS
jgi:hypothetical protein